MIDDVLQLRESAGVLHAVMTRPPANALGAPLVDGLVRAVDALASGPAKVLVLSSGLPGVFAAGADIKHMSDLTPEAFAAYRDALRKPLEELAGWGVAVIAGVY